MKSIVVFLSLFLTGAFVYGNVMAQELVPITVIVTVTNTPVSAPSLSTSPSTVPASIAPSSVPQLTLVPTPTVGIVFPSCATFPNIKSPIDGYAWLAKCDGPVCSPETASSCDTVSNTTVQGENSTRCHLFEDGLEVQGHCMELVPITDTGADEAVIIQLKDFLEKHGIDSSVLSDLKKLIESIGGYAKPTISSLPSNTVVSPSTSISPSVTPTISIFGDIPFTTTTPSPSPTITPGQDSGVSGSVNDQILYWAKTILEKVSTNTKGKFCVINSEIVNDKLTVPTYACTQNYNAYTSEQFVYDVLKSANATPMIAEWETESSKSNSIAALLRFLNPDTIHFDYLKFDGFPFLTNKERIASLKKLKPGCISFELKNDNLNAINEGRVGILTEITYDSFYSGSYTMSVSNETNKSVKIPFVETHFKNTLQPYVTFICPK